MTVFVNDSFTEVSNKNLDSHVPDTGGAWVKRAGTGHAIVNAAADNLQQATASTAYTNSAIAGSAEYDVEATPGVFASGSLFLNGRFVDINNYYYALQEAGLSLCKRVAGVWTQLASAAQARSTATYKLEIRNATKKVYVGGVEKLSSADNELTYVGLAGLNWWGATSNRLDNFVATDAGAPSAETAIAQPMKTWWPR